MKLVNTVIAVVFVSGCATSGDYQQYIQAQADANRLAIESQKPLVRLTAQPGQVITGLASVEVYAPAPIPVIHQARPNEWAGVVGQGLSIIGTVAGIKAAGDAAVNLAESVGKSSTTGYQYIMAPQANVITTTTTTSTATNTAVRDSGNTSTQTTTGSYNPSNRTTTLSTAAPETQ